jgi:hypothetical protein
VVTGQRLATTDKRRGHCETSFQHDYTSSEIYGRNKQLKSFLYGNTQKVLEIHMDNLSSCHCDNHLSSTCMVPMFTDPYTLPWGHFYIRSSSLSNLIAGIQTSACSSTASGSQDKHTGYHHNSELILWQEAKWILNRVDFLNFIAFTGFWFVHTEAMQWTPTIGAISKGKTEIVMNLPSPQVKLTISNRHPAHESHNVHHVRLHTFMIANWD